MPLHLLGKKSWNVYNTANIEKVKRDEAAAAAREEADEQRMREADAERRIQLLRGLEPPPSPPIQADKEAGRRERREEHDRSGRERKRRKIAGEDETDMEMRYAQEDASRNPGRKQMQMTRKESDAPLTDQRGHISIFPAESSKHAGAKNAEAAAEKSKRKREFEDQYTMRFSNAAGFKNAIGQTPWYQALGEEGVEVGKDVWGNEDPRRREREKARLVGDDPLGAIKRGVAGVREVERERGRWREERGKEVRAMEREERRERESRRRKRGGEEGLAGFSLDGELGEGKGARSGNGQGKEGRHWRDHRSRSPQREYREHRHRHRSVPGWEARKGGRYSNQFAQA